MSGIKKNMAVGWLPVARVHSKLNENWLNDSGADIGRERHTHSQTKW
jgi:hypothetical protein